MTDLLRAAARLQGQLDELNLPNCVIGGLALQFWGEVRMTRDADFTVLTGFNDEESKIESMLLLVKSRIPDPLAFALANRVILGFGEGNVSVDLALGGFEYENRVVERAVVVEILPDTRLRVCGPEDLIVLKAFAGRDQDWIDIKGIILRQANFDWGLIESELSGLLALVGDSGQLAHLQEMRLQG